MPMVLTAVAVALFAKLLMMYDDSKAQERLERKIQKAPPGQGTVRMLTREEWDEIQEIRPRTPFESKLARPNARIRTGEPVHLYDDSKAQERLERKIQKAPPGQGTVRMLTREEWDEIQEIRPRTPFESKLARPNARIRTGEPVHLYDDSKAQERLERKIQKAPPGQGTVRMLTREEWDEIQEIRPRTPFESKLARPNARIRTGEPVHLYDDSKAQERLERKIQKAPPGQGTVRMLTREEWDEIQEIRPRTPFESKLARPNARIRTGEPVHLYDDSKAQERLERKIQKAPPGQGTVRMLTREEWDEIQEIRPRTPFESKLARPNARIRTGEPVHLYDDSKAQERLERKIQKAPPGQGTVRMLTREEWDEIQEIRPRTPFESKLARPNARIRTGEPVHLYDDSKAQERLERKIQKAPPGQGTVRMLTREEWDEIQEIRPRTPFESKLARPNARIRTGEPVHLYDDSKAQERLERKIQKAPPGQGTVRMLTREEWDEIQEIRPRTPFESKLARPNARIRTGEPVHLDLNEWTIDVFTDALTRAEESVKQTIWRAPSR